MAGLCRPGLAPLAELRGELGLSRERLAYLSGVSPRTIYRIEHREARPTAATLAVLAAVLGCDPADLLDSPRRNGDGGE